ncbi:MAG: putative addiction module antidote protein [Thalassotalea sp.]|nr:putative addiction module antidote protein [Thalassotalea sp.]
MGEKTHPYNPFDFIETQEEINDFMLDCFNDEDPRVFVEALGFLVKKHGVSDVAEATGLNRENLYRTLSGKSSPKWDTVHKLMKCLNLNLGTKAFA